MKLPCLLALLLLMNAPLLAQTQTRKAQVYRCGPDGRDLRDSPCPAGQASPVEVSFDQPSPADSRAARERHLAEARRAGEMAQARRTSEAQARRERAQAVGLQTLPQPAQAASAPAPLSIKGPKPPKEPKPPRPPRLAASAARAGR